MDMEIVNIIPNGQLTDLCLDQFDPTDANAETSPEIGHRGKHVGSTGVVNFRCLGCVFHRAPCL